MAEIILYNKIDRNELKSYTICFHQVSMLICYEIEKEKQRKTNRHIDPQQIIIDQHDN